MAVDPFFVPDSDPVDGARDGVPRGTGRVSGAGEETLGTLTAGLVAQAGVVRDAVLREASGLSLRAALDLAAVVEDAARVLRHAQLLAAGAVAQAYERPLDTAPTGLGVDPADGSPLSFGAASRLAGTDAADGDADAGGAGGEGSGPGTASGAVDRGQVADAAGVVETPGSACASEVGKGRRGRGRAGRRAGYRTPAEALRVRLRLSGAQARARMVQARDVLPGSGMLGQAIDPVCPLVGDLVAEGVGDPDAVGHIVGGLAKIRTILRGHGGPLGPVDGTDVDCAADGDDDAEAAAGGDGEAGAEPGAVGRVAALERILVDAAREVDADDVRQLVVRCVNLVDQDGPAPSEADLERLQGVFFSGRRDGLHQIRIVTDDAGREVLETIFATGTNPRVRTSVCDPDVPLENQPSERADNNPDGDAAREQDAGEAAGTDGAEDTAREAGTTDANDTADTAGMAAMAATDVAAATGDAAGANTAAGTGAATGAAGSAGAVGVPRDGRSVARRRLDALLAACGAALRAAALPATGGLPTQVMVTVGLEELQKGLGSAQLPYTGPVPVRAVRRMACDAGIIPVVLGTTGRVLDVGRTRRLFPDQIRRALVARDGGCAFPGCQAPAPWCEAHHIQEWWNDGISSIDNAVLLCCYHHHLVHEGHWGIEMVSGMPRFVPPWREPTHPGPGPYRNRFHRPPFPPRRT